MGYGQAEGGGGAKGKGKPLFERGEKVAIGASGGKDSTVLAYIMTLLNERYDYGLELSLLSIDEGISGYRDASLDTVKRNAEQYGLPLTILSYHDLYNGWTMDRVVAEIGKKGNCTYCGVFRRQALDRGADQLTVDHVVTGHNADDVAETVLMNVLRGDFPRLERCTAITTGGASSSQSAGDVEGGRDLEDVLPRTIKRSKPFKYAYEKEIVMYAYFKKLDYHSTECIYSPTAYRGYARALVKDLESIRPSAIVDIIYSGEAMASSTKLPGRRVGDVEGAKSSSAKSSQPSKYVQRLFAARKPAKPRIASTMSLIVDKWRPKSLADLQFHDDLSERLRSLARTDFPHTLFYGPSGAGKKTRIMCTLRELFGPGIEKVGDAGNWDRSVIQEVLKEIAQTQQVDLNAKKRFKVVIINEADLLSRDAQSALRRTMEKFTANLRLILCANSTSRIIGPIRSRCLLLRVGAPSEEQISHVLHYAASKEMFLLPDHVALLLARLSQGNLRRALLSLEALYVQDPAFKTISEQHTLLTGERAKASDLDTVPRPDWEKYAGRAAEKILGEQSPERLLEVRGMLYELLVHCIPATLIVSTITKRLLERVDEDVKYEIATWAAFYEHRIKLGSKPIFHLEAFCAKIMSIYKQHLLGLPMD
ncbi:Replication factor C (RF-C) subunit [Microbotryomycetes sp. JL201]|nr:Replication factor C (RF-C) subunit [Microbotryomycetes sp. JL201]